MASNPVTLNLAAFIQGMVTCVSNAGYWQRATLTWGTNQVVFQGSGERKPMTWGTAGNDSYALPMTRDATTMTVLFEYSPDGQFGQFRMAKVSNPVVTESDKMTRIEVTSEDSVDNDNNDTYFSIMLVKSWEEALPASSATGDPAKLTEATDHVVQPEDSTDLQLHAKTYYNNPVLHGGDEHYVTALYGTGTLSGRIIYGGPWQLTSGGWRDEQTPFGGNLHVFLEAGSCPHPGMESCRLQLSTIVPYWFSRPTGAYLSPVWAANLIGCEYAITSVTP